MPRERVQHGDFFLWEKEEPLVGGLLESAGQKWMPGQPVPDGMILREEPSLDLTWRHENVGGWVQFGFAAPRDWWERFIESYANSPEQHHFTAWTSVLSREEINKTIRMLRKARDAAYGADA